MSGDLAGTLGCFQVTTTELEANQEIILYTNPLSITNVPISIFRITSPNTKTKKGPCTEWQKHPLKQDSP